MCERLAELREAMTAYAVGFDAGLVSSADARVALDHANAIGHMAATVKALAAARVAEGTAWKGEGQRSAAHGLARDAGTSLADARQALDTGRRLAGQPEVAAAARRGALSPAQASAISDAAAADPGSTGRLLAKAADGSLADLRDDCARTKADVSGCDAEQRRAEIRARRGFRSWTDAQGEWHCRGNGNAEDGAQIMAALCPITDAGFRCARDQGRRERPEAYAFDALVELCLDAAGHDPTDPDPDARADAAAPTAAGAGAGGHVHGGSGPVHLGPNRAPRRRERRKRRGAPVKLLLRMDYDTWLRGFPVGDEMIELVGYGPVAMSAARQLLDMGDPFVAAVLTRGKAVAGVAHLGRQPTAHQRSALEWLYPACAVEGCPARAHLEIDHRVDWAKTHYTLLDLLDRLCRHHHNLKTRDGWELIEGTGRRPFVPPGDPRHPRHRTRHRMP